MRFALGVEYQGKHFFGWQSQRGLRTVEGELTRAISFVANHPIKVHCAGRTDKGVHAAGQVVHFDAEVNRSDYQWLMGINSQLPKDVAVQWIREVDESFHARFSATRRYYRYYLINDSVRSALLNQHCAWHWRQLKLAPMQTAANYLLGEHDFSSFRAAECQANSPVRTITEVNLQQQGKLIWLDLVGNAFLHHMVRNIMGSLLEVGEGCRQPGWLQEVLEAKDRCAAGKTAPPEGLYLARVDYPSQFNLPEKAFVDSFSGLLLR